MNLESGPDTAQFVGPALAGKAVSLPVEIQRMDWLLREQAHSHTFCRLAEI